MKNFSAATGEKVGFFKREAKEWFGNIVGDLWGGAVTCFALLPEVIGFMIVVGVEPYMGLFTCIILTIWLAFTGGRPGMISAGAGSTALVLAGLIATYGKEHPEYVFAAMILAGLIQFVLGICRVGSLIKFIPDSVMKGFVNGFAIVIFVSQLKLCIPQPNQNPIEMYLLIAAGIAIIILFPLLKKPLPFLRKVPESFVAIVLITAYALIFRSSVPNIGDMGNVQAHFGFVGYAFSHIGGIFTGECLSAVIVPAISIAFVGLIESLLTARMVDEETKTPSNKNRECIAEGVGNVICGSLGAMPGCGMIAMTVTNLKSGGKGRLSQFVAGGLMAVLLFTLAFLMESIPIAALSAVMFVVCFHTINWESFTKINTIPIKDTVVMAITVIIMVGTDNLLYGVVAGVAVYAIVFGFEKIGNSTGQLVIAITFFIMSILLGLLGLNELVGTLPSILDVSIGAWSIALAVCFACIGCATASVSLNAGGNKILNTIVIVGCIVVGGCCVAGASVLFEAGPWYSIMAKTESLYGVGGTTGTIMKAPF